MTNAEPSEDLASIPIAVIEPSVLTPAPFEGEVGQCRSIRIEFSLVRLYETAEDPNVENELVLRVFL